MRILVVCPDWFPFSAGLARSCHEFCLEAEKHGNQVRVITASDPGLDSKGLDVIGLKYIVRLGGKSPIVLNFWKKIKTHILWSEVILLYSYMFEMNSRIVLFRKLGFFQRPLIHMYRGSLENDVLKNVSFPIRLMKFAWDNSFGRIMFTGVDKTISNSKPTLGLIEQKFKIEDKNLAYVPNGYYLENFKRSDQKSKRVLFIGRLVENKGILLFEHLMKSIPSDWKFTIIGDGPLEPTIQRLKSTYSQIEFTGKLPDQEVKEFLANSSILVLPSFAEGSPRVVAEAMASGVVPVCFEVGDVPSILNKDLTMLCIKAFDIKQFTSTVHELISNDKLRREQADKVFQQSTLYSWDHIYPILINEINNLKTLHSSLS